MDYHFITASSQLTIQFSACIISWLIAFEFQLSRTIYRYIYTHEMRNTNSESECECACSIFLLFLSCTIFISVVVQRKVLYIILKYSQFIDQISGSTFSFEHLHKKCTHVTCSSRCFFLFFCLVTARVRKSDRGSSGSGGVGWAGLHGGLRNLRKVSDGT